ncbi:peptidylprolyl isomerase [Pusillimonas minor]|uniref:peptidylprolyl isomerase n=1 Tax=Pusillimonas minor TaxID=2697024 RepID=A0A842HP65_9BURK|nr:peptidylprolyl isomerase [Pusillimonas minor]MBC2768705.1 peptidylprolyl isomerase [Pusillimonas minor]
MKKLVMFAAACAISVPVYAQNVATVNGKPITQAQIDQFVTLLVGQGAQDTPQLREQVKQEMIGRMVAVQAAERARLDRQEDVKQELEMARQSILVRALMEDYLKQNPVTDQEIQAEYDEIKKAQADAKEYKVSHILVADEGKAKELTQKIKAKEISFEDAAKADSIDPGSAKEGGSLGWAQASNYVPEFAEAVERLKNGEMTAEPVKSQFGWHIVRVDDSRAVSFPELAEVKPQLEEMMRQEKLAQYQKDLMDQAKIQ